MKFEIRKKRKKETINDWIILIGRQGFFFFISLFARLQWHKWSERMFLCVEKIKCRKMIIILNMFEMFVNMDFSIWISRIN